MGTFNTALAQQDRGVTRNSLIENNVQRSGLRRHSRGSCFPGGVLKVGRGKRQRLPKVFRFQFRIIPEEIIPVGIQRHSLYNPSHSQPHPAYARLTVHLIRVPSDSVERLHSSYFDTFLGPICVPRIVRLESVLINALVIRGWGKCRPRSRRIVGHSEKAGRSY